MDTTLQQVGGKTGHTYTDEGKAWIRQYPRKSLVGFKHTEETKAKVRYWRALQVFPPESTLRKTKQYVLINPSQDKIVHVGLIEDGKVISLESFCNENNYDSATFQSMAKKQQYHYKYKGYACLYLDDWDTLNRTSEGQEIIKTKIYKIGHGNKGKPNPRKGTKSSDDIQRT